MIASTRNVRAEVDSHRWACHAHAMTTPTTTPTIPGRVVAFVRDLDEGMEAETYGIPDDWDDEDVSRFVEGYAGGDWDAAIIDRVRQVPNP